MRGFAALSSCRRRLSRPVGVMRRGPLMSAPLPLSFTGRSAGLPGGSDDGADALGGIAQRVVDSARTGASWLGFECPSSAPIIGSYVPPLPLLGVRVPQIVDAQAR